jgi:hypothetical protein
MFWMKYNHFMVENNVVQIFFKIRYHYALLLDMDKIIFEF